MKTLLVGYKAADLTPELLEGDVTCHVLDIYHRHAIEKVHHAKVDDAYFALPKDCKVVDLKSAAEAAKVIGAGLLPKK